MVWTQEVSWHSNMAQPILLLYAIKHEKTVKFMQVDRLLSASNAEIYPAVTRSNNYDRYTVCLTLVSYTLI